MSTNFDRRQFLLGSTALVAAGAVAPAFAQDAGRLRLYWWGGQARADRTNKVSDLFKSKVDPKVTIDGEYNGSFQDYWTKLDTQVAATTRPTCCRWTIATSTNTPPRARSSRSTTTSARAWTSATSTRTRSTAAGSAASSMRSASAPIRWR